MPFNRAQKRYNRDVLILMTAYVIVLTAVVVYARSHWPLRGVEGVGLALLPALPIIGVFGVMARYLVEERDEYIRSRFVQQALVATGLTLSICTAWGFLENFGVAPHIYAYYAAILWFGSQGLVAIYFCLARLLGRRGAA
jgi:hypothetical protein